MGVALDVTRARAQLAGTRAQLIAARNERDRARLELARAAGLSLDSAIVLRDSLGPSAAEAPNVADAIAAAIRDRADLHAAAPGRRLRSPAPAAGGA